MAMCDSQSYPELVNSCVPDSNVNIVNPVKSPYHPGAAYMELQFYPPGYVQQWNGFSCSATQWCVALTIDSLSLNSLTGQTNNVTCESVVGEEYVNFAYLTHNGKPQGPPNPVQFQALGSGTPNPHKVEFLNQGDNFKVTLHDTPHGLQAVVNDTTNGFPRPAASARPATPLHLARQSASNLEEEALPGSPDPAMGRVAQPVLSPLTGAAIFLVVTINTGGEAAARDLLSDCAGLQRAVGFRIPEGELTCVAGVGSAAWDRLFSGPRPAELHPFPEIVGNKHRAVSTPGDLHFHIRATQMDLCFELAGQIMNRLRGKVTIVDEVHGFKYFDERDLLGFVDGTENPTGRVAYDAVIIGSSDDAFAGGSYVIVQKYLHDLEAWNALPVEAQERVIGRTKLDDIELPDSIKPSDSHVALNVITGSDGTELKILRDNMPFGRVGFGEFGTYYIAYANTPEITERMLTNMFIGDPPGNYDRVLDFSTAVTGTLFFVPPQDFLDALPDPPPATG
jgi:putative iron-dependent peroxidase